MLHAYHLGLHHQFDAALLGFDHQSAVKADPVNDQGACLAIAKRKCSSRGCVHVGTYHMVKDQVVANPCLIQGTRRHQPGAVQRDANLCVLLQQQDAEAALGYLSRGGTAGGASAHNHDIVVVAVLYYIQRDITDSHY